MFTPKHFELSAILMTGLGTFTIAITGVFGYFLLKDELQSLQLQNSQTEMAISQGYRPLGVVRFEHDKPDVMKPSTSPGSTKDRFGLGYNLEIFNAGKGPLLFLGYLRYVSDVEIQFRNRLLTRQLDSVVTDQMYTYSRLKPILVSEYTTVLSNWGELSFKRIYYLYSLFFYLDQDGNLYDTEHLDVWRFRALMQNDTARVPPIEEKGSYFRDLYHKYTPDERAALIQLLDSMGSTMVSYLR